MNPWLALVWLIFVFLLMVGLRRWIELHVQGVAYLITGHPTVALWVFFLIFLPGTLVHELSHGLAALLTGGRFVQFTITPDASGLATSAGGWRWLIIPAGYLGQRSLVDCYCC